MKIFLGNSTPATGKLIVIHIDYLKIEGNLMN